MKRNSRRDLILVCGSWRREEELQQHTTLESCWEVLDAIAGSYIQTCNKIQSLKCRHTKRLPRRNGWTHPCWVSVTNRKVTPKQVVFNEHDECVNKKLRDRWDFGDAGRWIWEEIIKHEEWPFRWAFTEYNISRMCNAAGNYAFFSLQFLCKVKKTCT